MGGCTVAFGGAVGGCPRRTGRPDRVSPQDHGVQTRTHTTGLCVGQSSASVGMSSNLQHPPFKVYTEMNCVSMSSTLGS